MNILSRASGFLVGLATGCITGAFGFMGKSINANRDQAGDVSADIIVGNLIMLPFYALAGPFYAAYRGARYGFEAGLAGALYEDQHSMPRAYMRHLGETDAVTTEAHIQNLGCNSNTNRNVLNQLGAENVTPLAVPLKVEVSHETVTPASAPQAQSGFAKFCAFFSGRKTPMPTNNTNNERVKTPTFTS